MLSKKKTSHTYTGTVDHVSKQYAYIIVKDLPQDIIVTHANLQGAWHGDTVKIILIEEKYNSKKQGKVIDIVSRAKKEFIGKIKKQGDNTFLIPDHKRLHHPILLPQETSNQNTQKAIIEVNTWPKGNALAEGKVKKILGEVGSHKAETEAIILQFGFKPQFQNDLIKQADAFPDKIPAEEIKKRRDFRAIPTFTIDPDSAQDFDDALSIEKLPNGYYQIGIHIADVSHYVKPESPIDQEALQRGTSVYLVGDTIPMLPERLSNDLCSLRPDQDRLAFSVVIDMNEKAEIQKTWIGETIIHSKKRFTYAEAKKAIDTQKGPHHQALSILNNLAAQLRQKRIEDGAIPFDTTDFNIHLDEAGEPIHITPKQSSIAHQLIEEFMLVTNKVVAEYAYKLKTPQKKHLPFIYRIHDQPDYEKMALLSTFAAQLGYTFKPKKNQLPKAYQTLLTQIKNTPHQHTLQSLAIRTMAQASYTTQPKGHFGLAFKHYSHFTSPIRRYPDIIVHRLLKQYLQKKPPLNQPYQEISQHTSQRERLAIDAERASINYKQVVFMKKLKGQTLQGIISHITPWGLYIEIIENKCEGMVRITDIKDDYYFFEPKKFRFRGKRTNKIYQLGDMVNVQIKTCDLEKKTVDLIFV